MNPISTSQYSQMIEQMQQLTQNQPTPSVSQEDGEEFAGFFNQAIGTLEQKQVNSNHAVQSLIDGTSDDLHNVMIQTTEAQLSLEVAVQLRNRAIEAYNEIKNMQF